jgi:hypothetical protein
MLSKTAFSGSVNAARVAVNPPTQLPEEALKHLIESREQREEGETISQDDIMNQLNIDG